MFTGFWTPITSLAVTAAGFSPASWDGATGYFLMARRVGEVEGIVAHVTEPIQALRVGEVAPDAVRGEEATEGGIVVPCPVVHEPRPIPLLPGVVERRRAHATAAQVPPRSVLLLLLHTAIAGGGDTDAAQVIAMQ